MKPVCPECSIYMERVQCGVFLFEVGMMGCRTAMLADRFACPKCSKDVIIEASEEDGGWTKKGSDARGLFDKEKMKGMTQIVYEKAQSVGPRSYGADGSADTETGRKPVRKGGVS